MGYKSLIDSNLTRAFNLVKDLATTVEFVKKTDTAFDFATMAVTSTTATVRAKIIVVDQSKSASNPAATVTRNIMVKKKDVGDLSFYDKIVEGGTTWKIGSVIRDSGFILLLEIRKENG